MALRPSGVAMATMVSSGGSTGALAIYRAGDDDRFQEGVADALGADGGVLGNRQVDDAPFVGVQRPHLLRASVLGLLGHEQRHLPQLGVLLAAEAVAVDHHAAVVAQLAAERGGHQVLQRLQAFAAAACQDAAVLALDAHFHTLVGLVARDRQRHAHGADHILHEGSDVRRQCVAHPRPLVVTSYFRLSAGTRAWALGPIIQLVKYCCPMAHDLAHEPVQDHAARREQHHGREHDRHDHHDPLLRGIDARGRHPLLPEHRRAHQDRQDVVGVGCRQVVNPPDERGAAQLDRL